MRGKLCPFSHGWVLVIPKRRGDCGGGYPYCATSFLLSCSTGLFRLFGYVFQQGFVVANCNLRFSRSATTCAKGAWEAAGRARGAAVGLQAG